MTAKPRHDQLTQRLEELAKLIELAEPDLTPATTQALRQTLTTAQERLAHASDLTVVAFIGATGCGKSSLFNALIGADLAQVGVRRPTTVSAMAACPPTTTASKLLDWLQIPTRVEVPSGGGLPDNVILLDLPDIDSINHANRELVERLSQRLDVLVWVADPQKYADQVLHNDFIRPLASHSEVTLVTLTQVDRLTAEENNQIQTHLKHLLHADGHPNPVVVATSAHTGQGLDQLRQHIVFRAKLQRENAARQQADIDAALMRMRQDLELDHLEIKTLPPLDTELRERLVAAASAATGIETVSEAIARAYRHRAGKTAGWLPTKWIRRLRVDPLKHLHLDEEPGQRVRISHPQPASQHVLKARLRTVLDTLGQGRAKPWQIALAKAGENALGQLTHALAAVLAETDLGLQPNSRPHWWKAASLLQTLGWILALVGGTWLGSIHLARILLLINWTPATWQHIPLPTWMIIVGLAWTAITATLTSAIVTMAAKRTSARVRRKLLQQVSNAVERHLLQPLQNELERQQQIATTISRQLTRR